MKKTRALIAAILCLAMIFLTGCSSADSTAEVPERNDYEYIFVHGLSGWGSYDKAYKYFPYWGTSHGDLMEYLRGEGFSCHAASVDPVGSAWDRACELYAQLTGSVVDYGKEHSERCGHKRFGTDYSKNPLIADWSAGKKIVLLGHSFGGATIRMFSEILANGSAAEQAATSPEDLSDYFRGGQGDCIHALITLAAPTNGTTAYDLFSDENFDPESVSVPRSDQWLAKLFELRDQGSPDSRVETDYADYDMHIDNAQELNKHISTLPNTYYFAVPCSATRNAEDGTQRPVRFKMEGMFRRTSALMGAYTGVTDGGFVLDETWQENDGLVNTVSAGAPIGAPTAEYPAENYITGAWYVMPIYYGDHMSIQGGMTKRNEVRPYYLDLLNLIDSLPAK